MFSRCCLCAASPVQFVVVYNFALSCLSGILFYFLARELFSVSSQPGGSWFKTFCDPHASMAQTQGVIFACYYLNYLFKYVELVDTVLLCLRKKQTPSVEQGHTAEGARSERA